MSEYNIKINRQLGTVKITNYSDCCMIVSAIPIYPKRKHKDFLYLQPKSFHLFEHDLDIEALSFRFEIKEESCPV